MDFEHLISDITNAILQVPLVRDLMSFVDTRWRPLWAATWIILLALGVLRVLDSFGRVRARQSYLETNARVARQRGELPASEEERAAETAADAAEIAAAPFDEPAPQPAPALRPADLAHWMPRSRAVVLGAAAVAILLLGLFARPSRPTTVARAYGRPEGTSAVPVAPMPAPPTAVAAPAPEAFRFIDRGWRMEGSTCVATLEVDADAPGARKLTLFVQDASNAVLGQDSTRVAALRRGAFVSFRLRGVRCDDVAHWQVQG